MDISVTLPIHERAVGKRVKITTSMYARVIFVFFCALASIAVYASAADLEAARQLIQQGQCQKALDTLAPHLRDHPNDVQALLLAGNAYVGLKNNAKAVETFSGLMDEHPGVAEVYNNLAVLYADAGRLRDARETLLKAINLHPTYATIYSNLTHVYARMASIAYSKALENGDPETSDGQKGRFMFVDRILPPASDDSLPQGQAPFSPTDGGSREQSVTRDVASVLRAWSEAWSAKNADGYLAFYAPNFILPDGMSRREWEEYRRERLTSPAFIKVEIKDLKVQILDKGAVASTAFIQNYSSDGYRDSVKKVMLLANVGNAWHIVREETLE